MKNQRVVSRRALPCAAALAALAASCGGAGDLCSKLAAQSSCGDIGGMCRDAVKQEKSDHPECAMMLDAFTTCVAGLTLLCDGGPVARGTGDLPGGYNFTSVGGQSIVVNDARCGRVMYGLDACRSCPDAPGAQVPETRGIGEKCAAAADCAPGLSCQSGMCTRACTSDSDCHARADGCQLLAQFPNTCATIDGAQRCTTSCSFGDDSSCQFDFGRSAVCTNQQCIPQ